jgi:GDP-4-dehydro-6-deoxy-D-mannose reductase
VKKLSKSLRIFVTGVTGFVGPHLVRELENYGHEVWGASRSNPFSTQKKFERHVFLDLTDEPGIRDVLGYIRPDVIVHLAAQSNPALSWEMPLDTFESNVGMTVSLLRGSHGLPNPRFYFVSSSDVYGRPAEENLPIRETQLLVPDNPYAVSKVAAEHCARLYGKKFGIDVGIIRPFSHTGPGQTSNFVVPSFARQVAEIEFGLREKLQHGDLSSYRDFTDVRDIVKAYRLIVEYKSCIPIVNVCSGKGIVVQELFDRLVNLSSSTIIAESDPNRKREERRTPLCGSFDLLNSLTGWKPEIELDQTLTDVLNEQRENIRISCRSEKTK